MPYYVYILINQRRTVFYTGITNNLIKRVYEHKHHLVAGFTDKYNVENLAYFEEYDTPYSAIQREKQVKKYRREKKVALIESINPDWKDLYCEIA